MVRHAKALPPWKCEASAKSSREIPFSSGALQGERIASPFTPMACEGEEMISACDQVCRQSAPE
eukprot:4536933-Pyramimonas_sp.AAC.1